MNDLALKVLIPESFDRLCLPMNFSISPKSPFTGMKLLDFLIILLIPTGSVDVFLKPE